MSHLGRALFLVDVKNNGDLVVSSYQEELE